VIGEDLGTENYINLNGESEKASALLMVVNLSILQ
jgi:hypothetical protein